MPVEEVAQDPLDFCSNPCYHTCMKNQKTSSDLFHYSIDWKEGKVNQMWIECLNPHSEGDNKYVAVAYNPEKDTSMVMSKPRSHYDTLNWVRNFCGSFSILSYT